MTTRKDFDDWLTETEWIVGDVTISDDAMRAAPEQDEGPIRIGRFVGSIIDDD